MDDSVLERGSLVFKEWRETRVGRQKVPDRLWQICIEACKSEKVSKVSKTAGIDYYQLRSRLERAGSESELTVSALHLSQAPKQSVITCKHPSGWSLEIDTADTQSTEWFASLLN